MIKSHNVFSNIHYGVHYQPTKFELKTQLTGKTKIKNLIKGYIGPSKGSGGANSIQK